MRKYLGDDSLCKHLNFNTGLLFEDISIAVIFEQPFLTTIMTTYFSSHSIGQKQLREREEERE